MGFDESKWACRNLYIATFPQAGSCWSGKELEEIHIMDLLLEAGWEDPKTTLDAAQHSGGVPPRVEETANQLRGWDMYNLLVSDDYRMTRLN